MYANKGMGMKGCKMFNLRVVSSSGEEVANVAFSDDRINDAKAMAFDAIADDNYKLVYSIRTAIVLQEPSSEMPELSNIKECMEEFFEYADSCGVGALL